MSGIEPLALAAIAGGGASVLSAYQNKRAQDYEQNRQRQAFDINEQERQRQSDADFSRNQQLFEATRADSQRAGERDALRAEAVEVSTREPLAEILNTQDRVQQAQQERRDVSQQDLENSASQGVEQSGSGVAGNVSNDFVEGSEQAASASVKKAGRNIEANAQLAGLGDLQRDDIDNVLHAAREGQLLRGQAQRRAQIDDYLRRLDENRAYLDNTLAPNPVVLL